MIRKVKILITILSLFIFILSITTHAEDMCSLSDANTPISNTFSDVNSITPTKISQETLDLDGLKGELLFDYRFNDLYNYANELGYITPSKILRIKYGDGSIVTNVILEANDGKYLLLTKKILNGKIDSMLIKFDASEITVFDREGGVRIDSTGVNAYSTHQSCSASLCTGACVAYYGWGPNELRTFLQGIVDSAFNDSPECLQMGPMCIPVCKAALAMCTTVIACAPGVSTCVGCIGITCGKSILAGGQAAMEIIPKINGCREECNADPSKYPYPGNHCDPKKKEAKWSCDGTVLKKTRCDNCDYVTDYTLDCATMLDSSGKPKECGLAYSSSAKTIEYQCIEGCTKKEDCGADTYCTTFTCDLGKCNAHPRICPQPSDRCSVGVCEANKGCTTKPNPGCDHPDDNFAISMLGSGSINLPVIPNMSELSSPETEIAVLQEGFPESTQKLLNSINENFTFIGIDFTNETINKYPILVIPAGGLQGLSNSPTFKAKLTSYVENGGTIFAFSQQHGYEFAALPVIASKGELKGYGWLEDQSCQYASVYLDTYHPILSSISKINPDVNVDGYFTSWPSDAKVLLRRTKNGMPTLITYPIGKGRVFAYTAYSDWVFNQGATKEEINFVRDLLTWSKDPKAEVIEIIPGSAINFNLNVSATPGTPLESLKFKSGDIVNMNINVSNNYNFTSNIAASKVVFKIYDSDFKSYEINKTLSILPNKTITYNFSFPTDTSFKEGGYYIINHLYNSTGEFTTSYGGAFILTNDTAKNTTYYAFFVLRDPDNNRVNIFNSSLNISYGEIKSFDYYYPGASTLGLWQLDFIVYSSNDTKHGGIINYGSKFFSVNQYRQNPNGFAMTGKALSFDVNSDFEDYFYGSTGTFTITVWNQGTETENATVWYSFPHNYWSTGNATYGYPGTTNPGPNGIGGLAMAFSSIPPGGSETKTITIPVYSYDRLWATLYKGNTYLGTATRGFYEIPAAVNVNIVSTKFEYSKNESISAKINITNPLTLTQNGSVDVYILDQNNEKIQVELYNISLTDRNSSNKTIIAPNINTTGNLVFVADVYDKSGKKIGQASSPFSIPKDYTLNLINMNKPDAVYTVKDNLSFSIGITNVGNQTFSSNIIITIPDLAINKTVPVNIAKGESKLINSQEIKSVIELKNLGVGVHTITIDEVSDKNKKQYSFTIPNSKLVVNVPKKSFNASENIVIQIKNEGGIATNYSAIAQDYTLNTISLGANGTLQPDETKEIKVSLPPTLKTGNYYLILSYTDNNTKITNYLNEYIYVQGARLEMGTYKDNFNVGENITIFLKNPSFLNITCIPSLFYNYYSGQETSSQITIYSKETRNITFPRINPQLNSGEYTLSVNCYDHNLSEYFFMTKTANITGLTFDVKASKNNYNAGDTISFNFKNNGPINANISYIYTSLNYWPGISPYPQPSANLIPGQTTKINATIPASTESGKYMLYTSFYETSIGSYYSFSEDITVLGFDTNAAIDKNQYDAGENITLTLDNQGGVEGNFNCNAYLNDISFDTVSGTVQQGTKRNLTLKVPKSENTGTYNLSINCLDLNTSDYYKKNYAIIHENITIQGFNVTLSSQKDAYDVDSKIEFSIQNNGIYSTLNCSAKLNGSSIGSLIITSGKNTETKQNFSIPHATNSGEYNLNITCKDNDAVKQESFSKTITIKGLELDMQTKESVNTGQDLSINIINKGGIDANCDLTTELNTTTNSSYQKTLPILKSETTNYQYPTPGGLGGYYLLTITCLEQNTQKTIQFTKQIKVGGFGFEVVIPSTDYNAGDTINIQITNNGEADINATCAYTKIVENDVEKQNVANDLLVVHGTTEPYSFIIDEKLKTGSYKLVIGCEDMLVNNIVDSSALINIKGAQISVGTDLNSYNANQTIEVNLTNDGGLNLIGAYSINLIKDKTTIPLKINIDSININEIFTFNLILPISTDSGEYIVNAEILDDNTGLTLSDAKQITVNGMELELKSLNQASGNAVLELYNNGAITDVLSCSLDLIDKSGIKAHTDTKLITLEVGENNSINYPLPTDLVSGKYNGDVTCTESTSGNKKITKTFSINIEEQSAEFNVNLTKDIYLTEEDIIPLLNADITGKPSIDNANIEMKIYEITSTANAEVWEKYNLIEKCGFNAEGISLYENEVWFISYNGLCKYNKATTSWTIYNTTELGQEGGSGSPVDNDYIWFSSWQGIIRYTKSTGEITTYNSTNSPLSQGFVTSMTLDENNNLWSILMNEGHGGPNGPSSVLFIYNKSQNSWSEKSLSDFGLSSLMINSLRFDGNIIWFGLSNGLAKYDRTTTLSTLFNSSNSPIQFANGLAITQNSLWIINSQNGLLRYNKNSGEWINYTISNSELKNGTIKSIVSKDNKLFITYNSIQGPECVMYNCIEWEYVYYTCLTYGEICQQYNQIYLGVSSYDESTDEWKHYNSSNGLSSDYINSIKSSDSGVWFVSSNGVDRLTGGEGISKTLIDSKSYSNTISMPGINLRTFNITTIGTYELLTGIKTEHSQTVGSASAFFKIEKKNLAFNLSTENDFYRPNENIEINVDITNNANITDDEVIVELYNNTNKFSQETVSISKDETYSYKKNYSQTKSFTLKIVIAGVEKTKLITIQNSSIIAKPVRPDFGSVAPFDVGVSILNNGNVTAFLNVTINNETTNINVTSNSSTVVKKSISTDKNINLSINITGDAAYTNTSEIIFGESAELTLEKINFPVKGAIEIPYSVKNTGMIDSYFNATFTINNTTIKKETTIPFNGTINGTLEFNLTDGLKTLIYSSNFETKEFTIGVGTPQFEITSATDNISFTLNETANLTFLVKNIGGLEGKATLKLTMPGILEQSEEEYIPSNEEKNITFTITIPDDLEEKDYKFYIEMNNIKIDKLMRVIGANISVNAALDKIVYSTGDNATLTLSITNNNNLPLDLYSKIQYNNDNFTIKNITLAGFANNISSYKIPVNNVAEDKINYFIYTNTGRSLYISNIYVNKKDGNITIYTDKQVYSIGDNITITINKTQPGTLNFSLLKNTNETSIASKKFTYKVPELLTGVYPIVYSFIPSTQYSLNINDTFTYQGNTVKLLNVSLNNSLNRVLIEINGVSNEISGLAGTEETINGVIIKIDSSSLAGSVSMKIGEVGEYLVDIEGYYARIIDFNTDKEIYSALSTINLSANIESNKNVSGRLVKSIYNLQGDLMDSEEIAVTLNAGENKISSLKTLKAGTYGINKLTIEIFTNLSGNENSRLIYASKYFDVEDTKEPVIEHILELLNLIGKDIYQVSFNLTQGEDGEYTLTLTGYDNNGLPFSKTEKFKVISGVVKMPHFLNQISDFNSDNETLINVTELGATIEINVSTNITTNLIIITSNNASNLTSVNAKDLDTFINISAPELTGNITAAIIKLYYNHSDIPSGIEESSLRLWYYNETTQVWTKYDSPNGGVNTVENYVWALTTHFSTWGIFGEVQVSPPSTPPPAGGGPGGAGGGCASIWECQEWGNCQSDGTQKRICTDKLACVIKPKEETQNCTTSTNNKPGTTTNNIEASGSKGKESTEGKDQTAAKGINNASASSNITNTKGNLLTGMVAGIGKLNPLVWISPTVLFIIILIIALLLGYRYRHKPIIFSKQTYSKFFRKEEHPHQPHNHQEHHNSEQHNLQHQEHHHSEYKNQENK